MLPQVTAGATLPARTKPDKRGGSRQRRTEKEQGGNKESPKRKTRETGEGNRRDRRGRKVRKIKKGTGREKAKKKKAAKPEYAPPKERGTATGRRDRRAVRARVPKAGIANAADGGDLYVAAPIRFKYE